MTVSKIDFLFNIWWIVLVFTAGWGMSYLCSLWWFNRQLAKKMPKDRRFKTSQARGSKIQLDFEQALRVGFKVKNESDFEIIEGIGPTTNKLLKKLGYKNFFELSKADPKDIKRGLEKINANYKWIDTDTWPRQAELARMNRWYELKGLQDHLISSTVSETLILNKF